MILDESDVLVPLVGSSSKTRDHGVKDGVSWLLSGAILGEKRSPKYEASADCDVVASSPKLPLLTTDTDCKTRFPGQLLVERERHEIEESTVLEAEEVLESRLLLRRQDWPSRSEVSD